MILETLFSLALLTIDPKTEEQDAPPSSFAFLTREGDALISTHRLSYRFETKGNLRLEGPKNRTASFNGIPFEISLGAFLREDAAVMIHAERVADGSHASNYTRYPETDWPDGNYRLAPDGCFTLSTEDIEGEHDLEWLEAHDFSPTGSIYRVQYFASTDDFNDEVVVSFLMKVDDCTQEDDNRQSFEAIRNQMKITPLD